MKEEKLHEAMMNSFNLVTNRITYDDLFNLGKFFLIHLPDEPITQFDLDVMIQYFEDLEMYENCAELKKIQDEQFNDDGIHIVWEDEEICECKNPKIYDDAEGVIRCKTCQKRFSWWR